MKPRLLLMFALVLAAVSIGQAFTAGDLFVLAESPKARPAAERSSVASAREAGIQIDRNVLAANTTIRMPLFDGKVYSASRVKSEGLEIRGLDDLTWRGKLVDGEFNGDVVITQRGNMFSGIIYSPSAVYEIVAKGETQVLVQLDQSLFPACGGMVKGDQPAPGSNLGSGPATDSGDRVDVLVVYTAAVRDAVGGDAQAQVLAQQAIDATNTAYINSRIRQRVRLVGAQLTALVETGSFSTELSNLRADATTAALRNSVRADLVDMLTTSTANCGIAYLMGSLPGNSSNGYSVTARTCAVGNLTFAHELGHNMGSAHNPENGSGATFAYGYGHYVNGSYRTVMSYVDPCTSGCTRVAQFSNPAIIFNDVPTGINNARDNARSINNTADSIANFRYSGANIAMTSFNSGLVPRSVLRDLNWTSDNVSGDVMIELSRDEGVTWETLIASTPNDGSERITVGPRPSKRARVRITSLATPSISDSSVSNLGIR